MSHHLFAYGTLMSGENHLLLAPHAELIGPGRMRGRLFVVDHYPGLNGGGSLAAWVYVHARSASGFQPIPSGDWRVFHGELP